MEGNVLVGGDEVSVVTITQFDTFFVLILQLEPLTLSEDEDDDDQTAKDVAAMEIILQEQVTEGAFSSNCDFEALLGKPLVNLAILEIRKKEHLKESVILSLIEVII